MKKLIRVTQEDIRKGNRESKTNCPVAIAISRVFPRMHPLLVGSTMGILGVFTGIKFIDLPRSAVRFIKKFDSCKAVKPFNFYLDIPDGT